MPAHLPIVAACLSGVAFAGLGVAYRLAQPRRIAPVHLLALAVLTGTAFFGLQIPRAAPVFVLALGAAAGLGQYAALRLVKPALRLGPLSPMWCALSLGFVPSALYSLIVYKTPMSPMQFAGVGLATLAVVLGSLQQEKTDTTRPARPWLYGLVLAGMFVANALVNVGMSDLKSHPGYGENLFETHANAFMAAMYVALGFCVWADIIASMLISRRASPPAYRIGPFLGLSLMVAVASNSGLLLVRMSGNLSPAVTFTLSGMVSLLAAALISVTFFGEKIRPLWILMMLSAAASIPLVNLR